MEPIDCKVIWINTHLALPVRVNYTDCICLSNLFNNVMEKLPGNFNTGLCIIVGQVRKLQSLT